MTRKLKVQDEVVVIAGNCKGQTGKILALSGEKVIVEGVNIRKKHKKPTQQNQKGQIINIECAMHVSNVKPFINGKAVKLCVRWNKTGEKELCFKDEKKKEVLFRAVKKQVK